MTLVPHVVGLPLQFARAREIFFKRLRGSDPNASQQFAVGAIEWNEDEDLVLAAKRYAQAYDAALTAASPDALRDLLTLDSVTVTVEMGTGETEHAVVVLPTHPLRVFWFAAHANLLWRWEATVLAARREKVKRNDLLDPDLLADLQPTNFPAFALTATPTPSSREPLVFYSNLGVFYGVALPPAAPDPRRRYLDLRHMLGYDATPEDTAEERPRRFARRLQDYRDSHPYADPFRLALVNPDGGSFVSATLAQLLPKPGDDERDGEGRRAPAFDVRVFHPRGGTVAPLTEPRPRACGPTPVSPSSGRRAASRIECDHRPPRATPRAARGGGACCRRHRSHDPGSGRGTGQG